MQLSAANETYVLGREAGGLNVPPDDQRVSRSHCTLRRRSPGAAAASSTGALILDHSLNGTFVNGERVPKGSSGRALRSGDRIALVRGVRIAIEADGSPVVRRDEAAPEEEDYVYTYLEPHAHGADNPDAAAAELAGRAAPVGRQGCAAADCAAEVGSGEAAGAVGSSAAEAVVETVMRVTSKEDVVVETGA